MLNSGRQVRDLTVRVDTRSHQRLNLGVTVIMLLLLHAGMARAAFTPRIVNGLDTTDFPTTGALLYGSGGVPITADNAFINCSGTLIGCQTFLTAAHCVSTDLDPSHYWVYLQNAGIVSVSSVTYNPNYNPALSGNDVAIVKLAAAVTGIEPTAINSTHDLNALGVGLNGTIVGFGLTAVTAHDYGIKRYGAVQTANCVTTLTGGEGNDKLVCWDFAIPVGPPGTDSDTCNGDSGGPLFMTFNGVTEVVGVTSTGSSIYCRPLDHAVDASVYYNAAWIQSEIGADSTTTCGGIGPVGSSAATTIGYNGTLGGTHLSDAYSIDATGVTVLRVALNGTDYLFNPDLYVKAGPGAGPSNYDCKADGLGVWGSCEFLNPAAGMWSIFVADTSGAGAYQLTTTLFLAGAPASTPTPTTTATTTDTPLPPTPTQTPTDTPVPATATPTDTPVPPTATSTPLPTPVPVALQVTKRVLFGRVAVGQTSKAKIVTVLNPKAKNAPAVSMGSASAPQPFAIVSNGCQGKVLPAGTSCKIAVAFSPTVLGKQTGTLTIQDNASNAPQHVDLSGVGQ